MSGAPKFGDTHGVADDALCGSSSEYLFHFPTRVVVRRVLFCHPSLLSITAAAATEAQYTCNTMIRPSARPSLAPSACHRRHCRLTLSVSLFLPAVIIHGS